MFRIRDEALFELLLNVPRRRLQVPLCHELVTRLYTFVPFLRPITNYHWRRVHWGPLHRDRVVWDDTLCPLHCDADRTALFRPIAKAHKSQGAHQVRIEENTDISAHCNLGSNETANDKHLTRSAAVAKRNTGSLGRVDADTMR